MENLSKQQIILLTLLVSFVTSIATGIVTVALMNQTPVGVTQTINRVVERTIEKVVPSTPTKETQTIVKETVVVNVDDQVTNAIEKNSKSIVRIYSRENNSSYEEETKFVGVGVVVSDNNIIATDNNALVSLGEKYFIKINDNKNIDLTLLRAVPGEEIAVFKIVEDGKSSIILPKVSLISNGNLKLGQSVVYIGGESKNIVDTGIVSGINTKDVKDKNTASSSLASTIITSFETSIPSKDFISGGLLLNLSGELVGIKTTYLDNFRTDLFAPSNYIETAILQAISSQKNN